MKKYEWVKTDIEYAKKMGHCNDNGKRSKLFVKQYEERGWCDAELWNIDHEFGKWILPRIKSYAKYANGVPGGITEKEWKSILKQMIDGFEIIAHPKDNWSCDAKKEEKANTAMELFGKYGRLLWC